MSVLYIGVPWKTETLGMSDADSTVMHRTGNVCLSCPGGSSFESWRCGCFHSVHGTPEIRDDHYLPYHFQLINPRITLPFDPTYPKQLKILIK